MEESARIIPLRARSARSFAMLFMTVERFKNRDAVPVYRRFRDQGRPVTEGVAYVGSWVSADLTCCFQVMEAADSSALNAWLARWADLVDFQAVPVITSAEAQAAIARRLGIPSA